MKLLLIIIMLALCSSIVTSMANYDDVLLVTNNDSSMSINISNYYKSVRNITNQVFINTSNYEYINFTVWNDTIRTPIYNWLIANNKYNDINYIVLTKGVPLGVNNKTGTACRSVDSLLTMLNHTYAINGLRNGGCDSNYSIGSYTNPYFYYKYYNGNNPKPINFSIFNMRAVTRLDGKTYDDIVRLIGTETSYSYENKNIVIDFTSATDNIDAEYLESFYEPIAYGASANLTRKNISHVYNDTLYRYNNLTNMLMYYSHGTHDMACQSYQCRNMTNSLYWNFSFERGSMMSQAISYNLRTYNQVSSYNSGLLASQSFSEEGDGQELLTDMISRNLSSGIGNVYEPWYNLPIASYWIDQYTDCFYSADAAYSSIPYLLHATSVFGDPKLVICPYLPNDCVKQFHNLNESIYYLDNETHKYLVTTEYYIRDGTSCKVRINTTTSNNKSACNSTGCY